MASQLDFPEVGLRVDHLVDLQADLQVGPGEELLGDRERRLGCRRCRRGAWATAREVSPAEKGENKVRPCPKFPSSTDQQSYKDWRRRMMHWWAQALRMGVDEGLLGNELLQALQGSPKVAQNVVARMPPQVLNSPGAPPIPL